MSMSSSRTLNTLDDSAIAFVDCLLFCEGFIDRFEGLCAVAGVGFKVDAVEDLGCHVSFLTDALV